MVRPFGALFLFFAIAVALVCCLAYVDCQSSNATQTSEEALVWQGFDHDWQRRLLHVFETPHRLGSFANYIENEEFSSNTVYAESNVTFTPGVNGDYAYPATFFSVVDSRYAEEPLQFGRGVAQASFADQASNQTGVLEATTHRSIPITLEPPAGYSAGEGAVVLRGFRLDMHCNPDLQPSGDVCNSDGIWASFLEVNVTGCGQTPSGSLQCNAVFNMIRGCNPGCNSPIAPKPFNYVMSYDLFIYYTYVFGAHASVDHVQASQNTDLGVVTKNVTTVGMGGFSQGTVAITGFAYDLQQFDDIENLGRYLERLAYNVQDVTYDAEEGSASYLATLGYYTPLTTAPAHGHYLLDTTLLQFGGGVTAVQPSASPVNGTVCISDELFHCEFNIDGVKLEETTNDVVTISFQE